MLSTGRNGKRKNPPTFCVDGFFRKGRRGKGVLRFFDESGFEGLNGNPEALDATVRKLYADALKIRLKRAFRLLDELETDPAALLALTFVNDAASLRRTFSCDCANS